MKSQLFMIVCSINLCSLAQDTLYLKQQPKINVVVKEVTPTEIKYQRTDNTDGPVYTVSKTEVEKIIYKNGQGEVFPITEIRSVQILKNQSEKSHQGLYKIGMFGVRHYTENKILINEREFKDRVLNYPILENKDELQKQYAKQTLYRRTYKSMIPFALGAAAISLSSALLIGIAQNYSQSQATDYPGLLTIACVTGATSLTSVFLGIHFGIKAKKQKLKTLKVYNHEN